MVAGKPTVPKSYEEAVDVLARSHASELGNGVQIFAFADPAKEQVRLLEVTDQTLPSGTVVPIGFGRAPSFPFRSQVAQVTPEEWKQIERGAIGLPAGWDLAHRSRVWPL